MGLLYAMASLKTKTKRTWAFEKCSKLCINLWSKGYNFVLVTVHFAVRVNFPALKFPFYCKYWRFSQPIQVHNSARVKLEMWNFSWPSQKVLNSDLKLWWRKEGWGILKINKWVGVLISNWMGLCAKMWKINTREGASIWYTRVGLWI